MTASKAASKNVITPSMEMFTELVERLSQAELRIAELEEKGTRTTRGPKSENGMTEKDAFRVKFGDLKDAKHGTAAKELNLSYGQIFSCRGGYTFKTVGKDWKEPVAPVASEEKVEEKSTES